MFCEIFIVIWQRDIETLAQCFHITVIILVHFISGMKGDHYVRRRAFHRMTEYGTASGQVAGLVDSVDTRLTR